MAADLKLEIHVAYNQELFVFMRHSPSDKKNPFSLSNYRPERLFCEQADLEVLRDSSMLAGALNYFYSEAISSERSRTHFLRSTQSPPLKTTIKPLLNVSIFLKC